MTLSIVDSTVVIHLCRELPKAGQWLISQIAPLGVTPITWLEVLQGENSKQRKAQAVRVLQNFQLVYVEHDDQDFAISKIRGNSGIGINDCLIAAVAFRWKSRLYTHNLVHMHKILPAWQAVRPYRL